MTTLISLYPSVSFSTQHRFASALAALARKSRLFRASVVYEIHSGSSGSKVATFQYKCSAQNTFWQLGRAGQLVRFGRTTNELGIGWASLWVSAWALQTHGSAISVCDNNLNLMCVFMTSGSIVFSCVSVYNALGLQNKLRDGPLHNKKARGCFFSPRRWTANAWPSFVNCTQVGFGADPGGVCAPKPRWAAESAEVAHRLVLKASRTSKTIPSVNVSVLGLPLLTAPRRV